MSVHIEVGVSQEIGDGETLATAGITFLGESERLPAGQREQLAQLLLQAVALDGSGSDGSAPGVRREPQHRPAEVPPE